MKPTVIVNASTGGNPGSAHAAANASSSSSNGINIPINHEYANQQQQQQSPFHTQYADANAAYGSPNAARQQQQQQHPQQQQQPHHQSPQIPAHFQQGFGFEPDMDMDMDMFPRSRLGRMHDPFAGFGGTHFGFPQFGSMGRRRAAAGADQHPAMTDEHDFFNRLPSEFRQYIPETFGHRRAGSGSMPQQQQQPVHPQQHAQQQQSHPQQQQAYPQQQAPVQGPYYQNYVQPGTTPPNNGVPLSPSKTLCDAAIQTEDPMGQADEVDHVGPMQKDSLSQHGLRNTVDMGVKSMAENEMHGPRSHSAPPPEQQQQQHQIPINGQRATQPPPQQQQGGQHPQFGTQTSPQVQQQTSAFGQQPPQFQKAYYAPHQQSHPQQKQNTPPPPQTPGGTYIRTIPIFVEGRSEPIINSHKEIPNQNGTSGGSTASASASARAFTPQQQQQYYPQQQQQPPQQHRPTPLNTQQHQQEQPTAAGPAGLPPQTPHTLDSISKIQDIQRDVLDLMGKVENFGGRYLDKEYSYLDEMLTRNLLKLDTIDTNGKDSIRLARKEAIKCIQASINVLEAKAEENAKTAQAGAGGGSDEAASPPLNDEAQAQETKESTEAEEPNAEGAANIADEPVDATKIQEPIPLPAPEGMQVDEKASEERQKEASPAPAAEQSTTATESQTTVESK